MKKLKIIIIIWFCFITIRSLSQSSLLRVYTSGNSVENFLFEQRPVITFVGDSINIYSSRVSVQYPIDSIVKYTTHECPYNVNLKNIIIDDDKTLRFHNEDYIEDCSLHYKRIFISNEWETLYLPFDIDIENFMRVFEFASISNIRQYDDDDNGLFDRMDLEVKVLKKGTLKANYPYLIKAVIPGKHEMVLDCAILYPTEIKQIDCSSIDYKFVFSGSYSSSSCPPSNSCYSLQDGKFAICLQKHPFRWYMSIIDRFGEDWNVKKISVIEEGTGFDSIKCKYTNAITDKIYTIGGVNVDMKYVGNNNVYIIKKTDGSLKKVTIK